MQSVEYYKNGELVRAMEFFNGDSYQEVQSKMKDRLNGLENEFEVVSMKREKIGRNQMCPCGSGVKFKKCCINKSL